MKGKRIPRGKADPKRASSSSQASTTASQDLPLQDESALIVQINRSNENAISFNCECAKHFQDLPNLDLQASNKKLIELNETYNKYISDDYELIQKIYILISIFKESEIQFKISQKMDIKFEYFAKDGQKRTLAFSIKNTENLSKAITSYVFNRVSLFRNKYQLESKHLLLKNGITDKTQSEPLKITLFNYIIALTDAFSISVTRYELLPGLLRSHVVSFDKAINKELLDSENQALFKEIGIEVVIPPRGSAPVNINTLLESQDTELPANFASAFNALEDNSDAQNLFISKFIEHMLSHKGFQDLSENTIKKYIHVFTLIIDKIGINNNFYLSLSLILLDLYRTSDEPLLVKDNNANRAKKNVNIRSLENQLKILDSIIDDVIKLSQNEFGPKLEATTFVTKGRCILVEIDNTIYNIHTLAKIHQKSNPNEQIKYLINLIEKLAIRFFEPNVQIAPVSEKALTFTSVKNYYNRRGAEHVFVLSTKNKPLEARNSSLESIRTSKAQTKSATTIKQLKVDNDFIDLNNFNPSKFGEIYKKNIKPNKPESPHIKKHELMSGADQSLGDIEDIFYTVEHETTSSDTHKTVNHETENNTGLDSYISTTDSDSVHGHDTDEDVVDIDMFFRTLTLEEERNLDASYYSFHNQPQSPPQVEIVGSERSEPLILDNETLEQMRSNVINLNKQTNHLKCDPPLSKTDPLYFAHFLFRRSMNNNDMIGSLDITLEYNKNITLEYNKIFPSSDFSDLDKLKTQQYLVLFRLEGLHQKLFPLLDLTLHNLSNSHMIPKPFVPQYLANGQHHSDSFRSDRDQDSHTYFNRPEKI